MSEQKTKAQPSAGGRIDELLVESYTGLCRTAGCLLRREHSSTMQPAALVHEAYIRLRRTGTRPDLLESRQFVATAANAMRWILIEEARRNNTQKRGNGTNHLGLPRELADPVDPLPQLELDRAFSRLAQRHAGPAKVARCRIVIGLTIQETASTLSMSSRSVVNHWSYARSWLHRELYGAQAEARSVSRGPSSLKPIETSGD